MADQLPIVALELRRLADSGPADGVFFRTPRPDKAAREIAPLLPNHLVDVAAPARFRKIKGAHKCIELGKVRVRRKPPASSGP